jgi:hypothetical protein
MPEMTTQAYSFLHHRSEEENETALAYFQSRILAAKKYKTGGAWLPEALPMMEQGARTAMEVLNNLRKSKA